MLSVFEPLSLDLGTFVVPDWKCVGGLIVRLALNGLWPLALMLVVALTLVAREVVRKGSLQNVARRSLEAAVFISFVVLPSVRSHPNSYLILYSYPIPTKTLDPYMPHAPNAPHTPSGDALALPGLSVRYFRLRLLWGAGN